MGCNQSKQGDITADQQQRRVVEQPHRNENTLSPSRNTPLGIGIDSTPRATNDDLHVGMSYTDRREGEVDLLKRIVDTTAGDLIDMYSAGAHVLATDEVLSIASLQRSVQESRVVDATPLMRLPTPSTFVSGSVGDLLSEPTPSDFSALKSCGATVRSSMTSGFRVQPTGEIVVSLGMPDI